MKEQQIAAEKQLAADKQISADKLLAWEVEAQQRTVSIESIDFGACHEKITNPHQFCKLKLENFQQEWSGKETIAKEAGFCRTGSTDEQERNILFVPVGMGSGKSRSLAELRTVIRPELDEGSILIELRVTLKMQKSSNVLHPIEPMLLRKHCWIGSCTI